MMLTDNFVMLVQGHIGPGYGQVARPGALGSTANTTLERRRRCPRLSAKPSRDMITWTDGLMADMEQIGRKKLLVSRAFRRLSRLT